VRAKTSVTAARLQADSQVRVELEQAAREYLRMARQFLTPAPPALVAVGGFSGTGKSTLAAALAAGFGAPPGALVLRSDELRKRLCGVPPFERLGREGYAPAVSQRVYAAAAAQAGAALRAGYSVIADAVYARPHDREAIERVATDAGVPFLGLWLDAPEPLLVERLRQRGADVSDADADVVRLQLAQGAGQVRWQRLDAAAAADVVLRRAASLIGRPPDGSDAIEMRKAITR
jgi:predicted kinase